MNPTPDLERVFPLCGGSPEPARLRAPLVLPSITIIPGSVMGNRAFMRRWAARRAALRTTGNGAERVSVSLIGESLTASATETSCR
jgi:hypothetical protein